jgi:WD40 repeat protein
MSSPPTRCPVCGSGLTATGFCARCVLVGADPLPPREPVEALPDALYEQGIAVRYFGHFELLDAGREGGMGAVYHARQLNLQREVGLKMILGHCLRSADLVRRFRREFEVLAGLDHPNVLPILEVGEQRGQHYYSMKWVAEGSLADQMERWRLTGPGDFKDRQRRLVELLLGITHGVQHAHQRGILHRDLKPANVLVDGAGQPYVADFGLAKWAEREEEGQTQTRARLGSPPYMSPEQAAGGQRDLTTATDVWAMGVIFYELLTGRRPFAGSSSTEILKRVLETEPEAPRRIEPRIDRDLETICLKCLEKEPGRRYGSAQALRKELERWSDGKPIEARPIGGLVRLGKWVQRRPLVAGWIGATALALVLGLAGTTWQWQRAQTHERQARAHAQAVEARAAAESELLQGLRLDGANRAFEEDRAHDGLAILVSLLEDHPTNRAALTRLHSALLYRNWAMPVTPPLRHQSNVISARFSPDGTRVVTASLDGTARIWDAQTGQALGDPLRHESIIRSTQFSPDGTRVVTASLDGTARIWSARTGKALIDPLWHRMAVNSAQFSPDGTRVVTASSDWTARIWDAQTGQALMDPLRHRNEVLLAHFSHDGTRVVTTESNDIVSGIIRIWDARTGQALSDPLHHDGDVTSAQFSPDDTRVMTASSDGTVKIWDAQTGQALSDPLRHDGAVVSAQFSPDGTRVVTASCDGTARSWDARTCQALTDPLRHRGCVTSAQFSPDGTRLVTASSDWTARIWDAQTGQALMDPLRHGREVLSAQFSRDGTRVVTASSDGTARIWDARAHRAMGETLRHESSVYSAQFSPDGTRLVTASLDGTARIWSVRTGKTRIDPLWHRRAINSAQFSPDGTRVVTASFDGTTRIWNAQTGLPLSELLQHDGYVTSAQFSPDGTRVVTASRDGTARIWNAQTGQALSDPLRHDRYVTSAQFSPDGTRVLTVSEDGTAKIWDAGTGHALMDPLRHGGYVTSGQFSPDGTRVVTASGDAATVWDAQTGQALSKSLRHGGHVSSAQFSPDGTRVVTASGDGTARIWDAQTGQALSEPLRHGGHVSSAHFSPDGTRVVTASYEGTTRIWDARTGQALSEALRDQGRLISAQFSPDGTLVVTASIGPTAHIWGAELESVDLSHLLAYCTYIAGWRTGPGLPVAALSVAEVDALSETIAQLRNSTSADPAIGWLLAERAMRTISPYSDRTMAEHVSFIVEKGTQRDVEVALGYLPLHPHLLMKLATLILEEEDESRSDRALFLARLAAQQEPATLQVATQYLALLADLKCYEEPALKEAYRLVERFPENFKIAALQLRVLMGAEQWGSALTTCVRLVGFVREGISLKAQEWRQALGDHMNMLSLLGFEEQGGGGRAFRHLALAAFYNATLDNLACLDLDRTDGGLLELNGVTYNAQGIIQLSSTEARWIAPGLPERVSNIPVRAAVRQIHFLHGLGCPEAHGEEIARYSVRYADGTEAQVPLVYGEQIRDWQFSSADKATELGGAEPVWIGPHAHWEERWPDHGVRLYQLTWTNPRPWVPIDSLDFISTMTKSAPCLIAVTTE